MSNISDFPYSDWSDATQHRWVDDVVSWFEDNYNRNPQSVMAHETMVCLLDNVFEIIQNAKDVDVYSKAIQELGRRLRLSNSLMSQIGKTYYHHYRIACLLERNLRSRHSHMFMLPQISKKNLLTRPDYSTLLLAEKFHAAGSYDEARNVALGISWGCTLAQYIIGQSERKLGLYEQALIHLENGIEILETDKCVCPYSSGAKPICDLSLLKAVIYRAKAVVLRKQKLHNDSERFYSMAEDISEKAMSSINDKMPLPDLSDSIWIEQGKENALRITANVVADVYFSHGYFWYQRDDLDKAEELFRKAANALEESKERWDSPYTRLAVVKLCKKEFDEAASLFIKARTLCEKKPVEENREAPLSLALCSLGLRVIEQVHPSGPLILRDPLDDLEKAINQEPKLALGPLDCHNNDAKKLLKVNLPKSAKVIVDKFIDRLEKEISIITPIPEFKATDITKILFLASEPSDYSRLRLGEEQREIEQQLRLSNLQERFDFHAKSAVRSGDVSQALLDISPQIVHFSGHGSSDGKLYLEDRNGKSQPIESSTLADLFRLVSNSVNCVILNACYSDIQAKSIAQHIKFVIGMNQEIRDEAAIAFAVGFYQALGAGRSVDDAYEFGCIQVRIIFPDENIIPELIIS